MWRKALAIIVIGSAILAGMQGAATAQNAPGALTADVRLVEFPGASERNACRLAVRFRNHSASTAALVLGLKTMDEHGQPVNTWVVPSGPLKTNQTVERYYSCTPASRMMLDRAPSRVWPNTCVVDGENRRPCPLPVKVLSNLPMDDG